MMLNAMAPQLHHQQTAAGNPLISGASSSSVATISTSPSSSSSASSTTNSHHNHQQQQSRSHNTDHDDQSLQSANVASTKTTTTSASTNSTTTTTTTTTTTITTTSTALTSETLSNKLPAIQTTTSQSVHHQHQHQNHYQNNNNTYQSPRYNNQHHHNHQESHHSYNMSYAARSSNNNHRGHNSNHNHHNHHSHHNHHHHHNQNHSQHQHYHHSQQQQPIDDANIAVSSSASSISTSETTATTVSNPAQRLQPTGPPHYVDLHVNAGECVSLQLLDGQEQVVAGPATITMISQQQNPPVPIPVQVPPGHMIHQIADENGTLKHIILSVMDNEDGSQLDSTVITLPKGTFRIDSHGELVSTNGSDGSTLTTLPQQAYFANYDGCPVAYDATTLPDSIETTTPVATIGQTLVSDTSYPNHQTQVTLDATAIATNVKSEQEQNVENNSVPAYDKSAEASATILQETNQQLTVESKGEDLSKNSADSSSQDINKQVIPPTNTEVSTSEQTQSGGVVIVAPETNHQQMVVQGPISDNSYTAHQQPLGTEMDLMNGAMAPMLPPDGQLYGYPPCCCCCYCDPQEAANSGQQPPMAVASQQDVIIAPEHAPTGPLGPGPAGGARMSSRSSATGLSHTNGVVAYPNPLMAPIQGNLGMPLGVPPLQPPTGPRVHGSPMAPITNQNGITTLSGHLTDSANNKNHSHSGKGGRGSNGGYKQHKMMSNNAPSGQSGDRPYSGHYNHQSYNNIVSGHHHHHHHHQQHYQPAEVGGSSAAYKSSQALMANQGAMMPGNYPPAYSSFEPVPTTLANVVSSFNKPVHGNQGNHHHNGHGHHHHSNHQQSMGSNNSYRSSDSDNFMQRNTREPQVGYNNNHTNSYGTTTGGVRTQHNNETNNKRQTLNDKASSNNQQHNSNRYTAANIKVIGNNHTISNNSQASGNSNSIQVGSVSPIRSRIKNASGGGHHHNHLSNGVRNSSHFNGGPMQQQQVHEVKETSNMLPVHPAGASSFHSSSSSTPTTRDSSNLKSSRNNIHSHDHTAPISKHINSVAATGHHHYLSNSNNSHKQGPAWQHNTKFNANKTTPTTATITSTDSDILCDNPSTLGGRIATITNQSQIDETESVDSGGRKRTDSSEVSEAWSRERPAITHDNLTDKIEPRNEVFNSRTSRGKQKKCEIQIRIQPSDRQSDRHNNSSSTSSNKLSVTNETKLNKPVNAPETDGKISTANDKFKTAGTQMAVRSESKSSHKARKTIASPVKQLGKSDQGQKRVARDKSNQHNRITADKTDSGSSGSRDSGGSKLMAEPVAEPVIISKTLNLPQFECSSNSFKQITNDKQSSAEISEMNLNNMETSKTTLNKPIETPKVPVETEPAVNSSSDRNKHNNIKSLTSNNSQSGKSGGSSPTRNGSKKSAGSATTKQVAHSNNGPFLKTTKSVLDQAAEPVTRSPSVSNDVDSRIKEELGNDMVLLVSKPDSSSTAITTSCGPSETINDLKNHHQSSSPMTISMRTSLSENNIRSLELANNGGSSMKSTQTTPQKFATSYLDGEADIIKSSSSTNVTSETTNRKKGADKRRGSSAKTELVKLSSMPQLRLLNLNCTSVTSSSVQLRWSYIPSVAEKYGLHNHHHSGFKNPALVDHFVIECSNCKNVDTNTLVSPKTVYQGCALTCRVNQLSSEKIYHFKVRRTALLTGPLSNNKTDGNVGNGEHLVVSEILSVTLPSVQQQSSSGQQQQVLTSKKGSNGGKSNKANLMEATSSADTHNGNQALHGDSTTVANSFGLSGSSRGYNSSHSNNGNHSNGSNRATQQHQVKLSNIFKQCRTKFVTVLGKLVQKSLTSYSDTKFAGLLLTIFSIFAMLLAIFIHYYIVTPVTE